MSSSNERQVAVIGAGIAGLVTAKVLLHDGFDVVVLEKEDALGGAKYSHHTRHYPCKASASSFN